MLSKVYIQRLRRRWGIHRLGKGGLIDRERISFVAAHLVGLFFLFSSITKVAPANPWVVNLVTLLCLQWVFQVLHFFKIGSSQFSGKWRQGRRGCKAPPEGGCPEKVAHPSFPQGSMSTSPKEHHPREAGANRAPVEVLGAHPVFAGGCTITLSQGRDQHPPAPGRIIINRRKVNKQNTWCTFPPVLFKGTDLPGKCLILYSSSVLILTQQYEVIEKENSKSKWRQHTHNHRGLQISENFVQVLGQQPGEGAWGFCFPTKCTDSRPTPSPLPQLRHGQVPSSREPLTTSPTFLHYMFGCCFPTELH